ncbi:sulfur carrier protein ThiS [Pedobacter sp. MW01-1-1]|uniref:sulfur carrier protein ThiS n=1 Tax=Pedobacter sp. MW01-1-1 TaxID=3383027 RepID=UPI003FEFD039
MEITVNHQTYQVGNPCTLMQLIQEILSIPLNGIAVAINQVIISKKSWENIVLRPNDQIMIIKATQGG